MLIGLVQFLYGMSADTVYLCPAPLYHAAPLGWTMRCSASAARSS